MFNIGPQELLVILLVALVIVGPQRLPQLARAIGRALNELRRAQDEVTRTIRLGLDEAEPVRPSAPKAPAEGRAPPETVTEGAAAAEEDGGATAQESVVEVARTLGRGLAEIRRARREVQRTFRIDLAEDLTPPPRPAPSTPSAPAPAPTPPVERAPETGSPAAAPEPPEGGG